MVTFQQRPDIFTALYVQKKRAVFKHTSTDSAKTERREQSYRCFAAYLDVTTEYVDIADLPAKVLWRNFGRVGNIGGAAIVVSAQ